MKLLDRNDPGHGRNQLHIAASICNYDRVVELVERGLQPWGGDSRKVTPLGMLPTEVLEYDDDTPSSEPPKDFIVQGLKIKEYLELQMVMRTSEVKSLDLIDDPPTPAAPELDSPFQLEAHLKEVYDRARADVGEDHPETLTAMAKLAEIYMMQWRWDEAKDLLTQVLQKRKELEHDRNDEIDEDRSSLIAVLIALDKLEEARLLIDESLERVKSKVLAFEELPETSFKDTTPNDPKILVSMLAMKDGVVPLFPTLAALEESKALNHFIKACATTEDASLALILFDLCLVTSKYRQPFRGTEVMSHCLETIRKSERRSKALYVRLAGEMITRYCALNMWQEAEKELQFSLGSLDVSEAERFPLTYSMLLQVAEVLKTRSKWAKVEEIYEKLYSHTLKSRGRESYYATNTLRLM
ncbi:MAG: hypothetical protein Q9174_007336, partial [Haloplaca sp. 1 TL-2023]